jgi:reverse transcriptase-like protein
MSVETAMTQDMSVETAPVQNTPVEAVQTLERELSEGDRAAVIGAEEHPRVTNSDRSVQVSRVTRTAHSQATRSGRVPFKRVFNDEVSRLVIAMKAVHLDEETLGAPTAPFEAITLHDAMEEDAPAWIKAITAELRSLVDMNTFQVIKGVAGKRKIITSRWVLRKKFRANGSIQRHKARLVIRGFEQTYGVDYFATFASVIRYTTLRILLAKAAADDLEIEHVDVNTAFLNPILEEEVYMEIPQFFELVFPELKNKDAYLKLNKALYGLKQAPRAWLSMVQSFFAKIGMEKSEADPNLFTFSVQGRADRVFVLLYVDDMLIVGHRTQVDQIKALILKEWDSKDLGAVDTFVGFQIERDRQRRTLRIHQKLYTTKLLERFKMDKSNATHLPIPSGTVLKGHNHEQELLDVTDTAVYRQIVGSVLYLANNTRPDISYVVGQLARSMSRPLYAHFPYAKQLLRYLNGTRDIGIEYSNRLQEGHHTYKLYSDATWATEDDRVSFQGWAVVRYGGIVSWAAQRQRSTSQSSMEAEIVSASEAAKEAAWLEKLFVDIGERSTTEPFIPTLYCDNQGAIDLMHNPKFHAKAKHIDTRSMFVRNDMVAKKRLKVEHIAGAEQPADMLTKQLPIEVFTKHCRTLGLSMKKR